MTTYSVVTGFDGVEMVEKTELDRVLYIPVDEMNADYRAYLLHISE
jgi:hypothetical protein